MFIIKIVYRECNTYACDMIFLKEYYWDTIIKSNSLSHDSFNCKKFPNTLIKPFPTQRNILNEHIGQVFDYKDVPYFENIIAKTKEITC